MVHRIVKEKWVIGTVVLAITALTGSAVFAWYTLTQKPSLLQSAAEQATFPLYDPTKLPRGYALDQDSLSMTRQAMLLAARDANGHAIIITEQPIPKEFDFEAFYNKQLVGAQDITSIYGRGKAGIFDGEMSGSLVTDSTWIIIKGPKDTPAIDMKLIIEGLKPVGPQAK